MSGCRPVETPIDLNQKLRNIKEFQLILTVPTTCGKADLPCTHEAEHSLCSKSGKPVYALSI